MEAFIQTEFSGFINGFEIHCPYMYADLKNIIRYVELEAKAEIRCPRFVSDLQEILKFVDAPQKNLLLKEMLVAIIGRNKTMEHIESKLTSDQGKEMDGEFLLYLLKDSDMFYNFQDNVYDIKKGVQF